MHLYSALAGALLFATSATAHMQLHYPSPFNASNNPHRTTQPDPYLQYPYDCCGPNDRWTYPCRGYLSLLGTPDGAPTDTWEAGSKQHWSMTGIGNHYGGSCQVGFLDDGGDTDGSNETFRVATSYPGNCPHRNGGLGPDGQEFEFTVPKDLSSGVKVFAWVWYNREQEFNMNCAAVNITVPATEGDVDTVAWEGEAQAPPKHESLYHEARGLRTTVWTTVTTLITKERPAVTAGHDGDNGVHAQHEAHEGAVTFSIDGQGTTVITPSSAMSPVAEPTTTVQITTTSTSTLHSTKTVSRATTAPTDEPCDGADGQDTQQFKTANGCTCTCPSQEDIEKCVCYCFDPQQSSQAYAELWTRHLPDTTDEDEECFDDLCLPDEGPVHMGLVTRSKHQAHVPFHARPLMFIADDGNKCTTPQTTAELQYPDPGPDVVEGDGEYPLELPSGECGRPGRQAYHGN